MLFRSVFLMPQQASAHVKLSMPVGRFSAVFDFGLSEYELVFLDAQQELDDAQDSNEERDEDIVLCREGRRDREQHGS